MLTFRSLLVAYLLAAAWAADASQPTAPSMELAETVSGFDAALHDDSSVSLLQTHAETVRQSELALIAFAGDDDDDHEEDEDGAAVCDQAELAKAFKQMGGACKTDLLAAIASESALTVERRCECFTKVNSVTAAELTCKSQVWKTLTVAQEFGVCVAEAPTSSTEVCEDSKIETAMSYMGASCHSTLKQALAKDTTTLGASTRCECFMELNPRVANAVKCKINEDQQFTLAEEYAQCVAAVSTDVANPAICTVEELAAPFAAMDSACVSMLELAIKTDTPLTQEQRCACYFQVDDAVGLSLACMTMPAKKMTLAQEYQLCMTDGMADTCTQSELFGASAGLTEMSSTCQSAYKAAMTKSDGVDNGVGCDCYGTVSASNALSLRCQGLKGATGTVADLYQSCVSEALSF